MLLSGHSNVDTLYGVLFGVSASSIILIEPAPTSNTDNQS